MKALFSLLLFVFCFQVQAQNTCEKCDLEKVASVYKNIQNLSEREVFEFLCTFDASCNKKLEYYQFSNEALFKVLEKNPSLVISTLQKNKLIDAENILKEVKEPLLDYQFQTIYNKVKEAKGDQHLKEQFLEALIIAAETDKQIIMK